MFRVDICKKVYLRKHDNLIDIDCSINTRSEPLLDRIDSMKEMLTEQLQYAVEGAIETFGKSEMPDRFINGQDFYIVNDRDVFDARGFYNSLTDDIYFDADTITGVRKVKPANLLGHEIGHKIIKYKNPNEAFDSISSIFGIPRNMDPLIKEIYSDICGNIVAGTNDIHHLDIEVVDKGFCRHLNNIVLNSIYRG